MHNIKIIKLEGPCISLSSFSKCGVTKSLEVLQRRVILEQKYIKEHSRSLQKLYVSETCKIDLESEDRSLSCDINISSMYISDDEVSGPNLSTWHPYLTNEEEKPKGEPMEWN
jgi:hypothetical protein